MSFFKLHRIFSERLKTMNNFTLRTKFLASGIIFGLLLVGEITLLSVYTENLSIVARHFVDHEMPVLNKAHNLRSCLKTNSLICMIVESASSRFLADRVGWKPAPQKNFLNNQ
jgi:hypothetical protein